MKYMKSLVDAGENVGTIAAQSVGEPSTQMTLNTFHLAGHGAGNMTLGIPRLKEILMTCPYKIKTPYMKIFFRKDIKIDHDECVKFAFRFERLNLADIVKKVSVSQQISMTSAGLSRIYTVQLSFDELRDLEKNLGLKHEKLSKIFDQDFIPALMKEAFKQIKAGEEIKKDMSELTLQKKEEMDPEKEDQTISKMKKKLNSVIYDDEKKNVIDDDDELSENEQQIKDEVADDIDGQVKVAKDIRGYDEDEGGSQLESNQEMQSGEQAQEEKNAIKAMTEVHSKYKQYLGEIKIDKKANTASVNIVFPLDFKKVLMLTLAEQALSKVLVRSVPNIETCKYVKPKKDSEEPYLFVVGFNLEAFFKHQNILDVKRIETNHSYALKARYGVEAMRANIMKEVFMVFDQYGIKVDKRHLSLISDFMTFNGDYRAFNRIGMEESSSPFLKMSFETTMKYLVAASAAQERDDMSAPSSAVVMGQIPRLSLIHI